MKKLAAFLFLASSISASAEPPPARSIESLPALGVNAQPGAALGAQMAESNQQKASEDGPVWLMLRMDDTKEPDLTEPEDVIEKVRKDKANNKNDTLARLGNPRHLMPSIFVRRLDKDYRKMMQKMIEKDPEIDEYYIDPRTGREVKAKKKRSCLRRWDTPPVHGLSLRHRLGSNGRA